MAALKEGREVTGAIIQEGVHTSETWGPNSAPAEPVVYMIDHFVVGGFYRIHGNKAADGILNSPGMQFQPLAFAHSCTTPDEQQDYDAGPNRFYAYGVVARLALLAAAREIAQHQIPAAA
jgi:glutamate--cysteine ligase